MKLHRTITTLLIFVLNILCFSQFSGGSGTYEDPYLIETADQLNQVRNYMTSSFKQIADIDLGVPPWNEGAGWVPIGYYDPWNEVTSFRGNYDGNGFKISNMTILNRTSEDASLLGSSRGCILKNISLLNFNIIDESGCIGGLIGTSYNDIWENITVEGSIKGYSQMGLLAGFFQGYNIKNCHAKGEITSTGSGYNGGLVGMCNADSITNCSAEIKISSYDYCTGGLIGQCIDSEIIENCYATANISVTDGYSFGGFIGTSMTVNRNMYISKCYSEGSVSSDSLNTGNRSGGFIGQSFGYPDYVNISNCYSKSDVTSSVMAGGFIGIAHDYTNIENCYSTGNVTGNDNVGGFVGFIEYPETVTVTNCYWDTETSDIDSSAAGEGSTTVEMTYPAYGSNTYVGWDFVNVWADDIFYLNGAYPRLEWACSIEDDDDEFVAGDKGFELYKNSPNPFNPVTQIKFDLAKSSEVKLSVYNISGQLVSELTEGTMNAGKYSVEFDGKNLNSGVYYYVLSADKKMQSRQMLLLK